MRVKSTAIVTGLLFFALHSQSYSQGLFFHQQGEVGNREAYFSNSIVFDRTPQSMMLGSIAVKQLDVTVVYEAADKPEWADMRIQFKCPLKLDIDGKGVPKQPAYSDPVTMRLGEGGSYFPRIDLKDTPSATTDWQTVSSPVLFKARMLACNEEDVTKAMRAAYDGKHFSQSDFNQKMQALGYPEPLTVIPSVLDGLEIAWIQLWKGSKRPDPSGRWAAPLTAEKRAAALAKVAVFSQQLEATANGARAKQEPIIQNAASREDFYKKAAQLRAGQRSQSRNEKKMIKAWEYKTENDVVAIMGKPKVSQAADLLFLDYSDGLDNTSTTVEASGETWHEGVWNECKMTFVLMADAQSVYRVADLRIEVEGTFGYTRTACDRIMRMP